MSQFEDDCPNDWDDGFFGRCRVVANAWGQPSRAGNSAGEVGGKEISAGRPSNAGPASSWSLYKDVGPSEWDHFKDHSIVLTDGTNVPNQESGWLLCTLCNRKAMTKVHMEMHLSSTKHKRNYDWSKSKMLREAQQPDSAADSDRSSQSGVIAPPNGSLVTPALPYLLQAELSPNDMELLRQHRCEPPNADGWIICTLCNKKLMGMDGFYVHIPSKGHTSKMAWNCPPALCEDAMETEGELPKGIVRAAKTGGFYCQYCGAAEMSNLQIVRLHIEGVRHKNALRRDAGGSYPTDNRSLVVSVPVQPPVDEMVQPLRVGRTFRDLCRENGVDFEDNTSNVEPVQQPYGYSAEEVNQFGYSEEEVNQFGYSAEWSVNQHGYESYMDGYVDSVGAGFDVMQYAAYHQSDMYYLQQEQHLMTVDEMQSSAPVIDFNESAMMSRESHGSDESSELIDI